MSNFIRVSQKYFITGCLFFLFVLSSFTVKASERHTIFFDFNKNTSTVEIFEEGVGEVLVFPDKANVRLSSENLNKIESTLKNYSVAQEDKITLVLSGHHGGGEFSGKNGSLKLSQILEIFNGMEHLNNNVDVVFMRGCYTLTKAAVKVTNPIIDTFRNVRLIAGYEGKAWSSEHNYSVLFAQWVASLTDQHFSEVDLSHLIKTIPEWSKSELAIWLVNQENYGVYQTTLNIIDQRNSLRMSAIQAECNQLEKNQVNLQLLQNYFDAMPGYEHPPKDIKTSELRQAYDYIVKKEHCYDVGFWERSIFEKTGHVIRLIFYNNIKKNFYRFFSGELHEYCELSGSDLCNNFESTSRQSIMNEYMLNMRSYETNAPSPHFLEAYDKILVQLDPFVTPLSWATQEFAFESPVLKRSSTSLFD